MKEYKLEVVKAWFQKAENDLVLMCKGAAPSIDSELEDIEILSSYGVEVRYPDEIYYDIPKNDAQEAIDLAKKVKSVIRKYLEGNI